LIPFIPFGDQFRFRLRFLRGRRRDPRQAGAQAEDGSPGCTADSAVIAGRALSASLGAEWGESGSAAAAVAPAPDGAGTQDCAARSGCGGTADGNNWSRSFWYRGPADDDTISWNCWTD